MVLTHLKHNLTGLGQSPEGQHFLLAVSGGADSMALMEGMLRLREDLKFRLSVVHVHHGIRGAEADRDAEFVEQEAGIRSLPFYIYRGDVPEIARLRGIGLEEAARDYRYSCFDELMTTIKADFLVLAHHSDDQAETVLMRIIRGTGVAGLRAMRVVSGTRIRPMLSLTRQDIIRWCRAEGIRFCEDSTNQDTAVLRNALRHHILPAMEELNPSVRQALARLADHAGELHAAAEAMVSQWWTKNVRRHQDVLWFSTEALTELPAGFQKMVFVRAVRSLTPRSRGISEAVQNRLVAEASGIRSGGKVRAGQAEVCFSQGFVGIYPVVHPSQQPEVCLREGITFVNFSFERADADDFQGITNKDHKMYFLDYHLLRMGKIVVRYRAPQDYVRLPAGRKPLKEWFIEQRIPLFLRERLPVVAVGSQILWIPGWFASSTQVQDDGQELCPIICRSMEDERSPEKASVFFP